MSPKTARLTFVLPFFNEEEYLAQTVRSLLSQTEKDFILILVDNASTDLSPAIAKKFSEKYPEQIEVFREATPGKIFALKTGLAQACTELVGTLDADTIYPPQYVARTIRLFEENPDASCVMAFGLEGGGDQPHRLMTLRLFASLFPRKVHSGGCGQSFRRSDLELVGGFDTTFWPFVLEDHEIIHRVMRRGRIAYGRDHICYPAARRASRGNCSWNLLERIVYKIAPGFMMDWFFYRFLTRRFERRGLSNVRLREQSWKKLELEA